MKCFEIPFYSRAFQLVFVRCGPDVPDAVILGAFGLEAAPAREGDPHLRIVRGAGWAHVVDNLYDLHNSGRLGDGVAALARDHEVLMFWVGDADHSYELEWHRGGRRVRHRLVDVLTGERIDEGDPPAFEAGLPWPEGEDPLGALWAYVEQAGVELEVDPAAIRSYAL